MFAPDTVSKGHGHPSRRSTTFVVLFLEKKLILGVGVTEEGREGEVGTQVNSELEGDRDLGFQGFKAQQRVGWGPRALRREAATASQAGRSLLASHPLSSGPPHLQKEKTSPSSHSQWCWGANDTKSLLRKHGGPPKLLMQFKTITTEVIGGWETTCMQFFQEQMPASAWLLHPLPPKTKVFCPWEGEQC